jgi:Bacterial extracellular solute-binding protein
MATITSIAGGAPKPVFDKLAPVFERRSRHKLNALYDTMSGIAARVAAHEGLDVLVMPVPLIDAYVGDGTVLAAGRAALANIGLAVGVKAGGPVPDVSTPEALRAALLAARRWCMPRPGPRRVVHKATRSSGSLGSPMPWGLASSIGRGSPAARLRSAFSRKARSSMPQASPWRVRCRRRCN